MQALPQTGSLPSGVELLRYFAPTTRANAGLHWFDGAIASVWCGASGLVRISDEQTSADLASFEPILLEGESASPVNHAHLAPGADVDNWPSHVLPILDSSAATEMNRFACAIGRGVRVFTKSKAGWRHSATSAGHDNPTVGVALNATGDWMCSVDEGGRCVVARAADGHILRTFEANEALRSVTFDATASFVLAGSESGKLICWDFHNGELVAVVQAHQASILRLGHDPVSRGIVTVGADAFVRVWRLEGELSLSCEVSRNVLSTSAALMWGGALLVTCGLDGKIHSWDSATGQLVTELQETSPLFQLVPRSANVFLAAGADGAREFALSGGAVEVAAGPIQQAPATAEQDGFFGASVGERGAAGTPMRAPHAIAGQLNQPMQSRVALADEHGATVFNPGGLGPATGARPQAPARESLSQSAPTPEPVTRTSAGRATHPPTHGQADPRDISSLFGDPTKRLASSAMGSRSGLGESGVSGLRKGEGGLLGGSSSLERDEFSASSVAHAPAGNAPRSIFDKPMPKSLDLGDLSEDPFGDGLPSSAGSGVSAAPVESSTFFDPLPSEPSGLNEGFFDKGNAGDKPAPVLGAAKPHGRRPAPAPVAQAQTGAGRGKRWLVTLAISVLVACIGTGGAFTYFTTSAIPGDMNALVAEARAEADAKIEEADQAYREFESARRQRLQQLEFSGTTSSDEYTSVSARVQAQLAEAQQRRDASVAEAQGEFELAVLEMEPQRQELALKSGAMFGGGLGLFSLFALFLLYVKREE